LKKTLKLEKIFFFSTFAIVFLVFSIYNLNNGNIDKIIILSIFPLFKLYAQNCRKASGFRSFYFSSTYTKNLYFL